MEEISFFLSMLMKIQGEGMSRVRPGVKSLIEKNVMSYGKVTMFVPNNDAFGAMKRIPSGKNFEKILKFHMLSYGRKLSYTELKTMKTFATVCNDKRIVKKDTPFSMHKPIDLDTTSPILSNIRFVPINVVLSVPEDKRGRKPRVNKTKPTK